MKELYELKDKLCDELKSYNKKDMSAGSLDVIDKLAHAIKNIDKIIDKYEMDGYSGNMGYRHAYNNEGIYSRGRNARRDSMGRYTSRGYSRDGYSYHDDMVDELRSMMEESPNEEIKQEFRHFIKKIESNR